MTMLILAAALAAAGCTDSGVPLPSSATEARKRVFAEEFDGNRIKRDRWAFGVSRYPNYLNTRTLAVNRERQWYLGDGFQGTKAKVFSVADGVATITARPLETADQAILAPLIDTLPPAAATPAMRQAMHAIDYSSGFLSSWPKTYQYGYFEARMTMPQGQKGFWPAFWLMSPVGTGEIDVIEWIGEAAGYRTNVHGKTVGNPASVPIRLEDAGAFHTYGILWTPTELVWYLDRCEVRRMATPPDMNQKMMIHLNLAVGGWAGTPKPDEPATIRIDYVRAFRL